MQDMCIQTEPIAQGVNSIVNITLSLEQFTDLMVQQLLISNDDFNSINYEKTKNELRLATASLNEMDAKLKAIRRYLEKLVKTVEDYNTLRF